MRPSLLKQFLLFAGARQLRNSLFFLDYLRDWARFRAAGTREDLPMGPKFPILGEKTAQTGFDRHYVFHPAWAARAVREIAPKRHVDVGSKVDFSALLSAFIPVSFYDYRPAPMGLDNLECNAADLNALPFEDNSLESLSCMHVVEHVGLGRYGDAIDPMGDLKAIEQLKRVVAPGGSLLFVVPIGKPQVQYNAHRIYGYQQILGYFEGFELRQFALIPDDPAAGDLLVGASAELCDQQEYGCGCFWWVKS
ncbi:MAG: DUF268 domain-containing protein [bacterium]|nr:DUF268 domain-containing protein [bacterium]